MSTRKERILDGYYKEICPDQMDDPKFSSLYDQYDLRIRDIFSIWHGRIVSLIDFMNHKAQTNHHFNANESRILIEVINQVMELSEHLKDTEYGFEIIPDFRSQFEYFNTFLKASDGSIIPEDYQKIILNKHEPIFSILNKTIKIDSHNYNNLPLKNIGQGAFATVFKYTDPIYGIDFAIKRLKKGSDERETYRFKKEYDILQKLKSPYVLSVYSFDEAKHQYVMEYCDITLQNYYLTKQNKITFLARKRIAQQFLYGMIYLHHKKILHRDLSCHNILLKVYDSNVLAVKLSDFGLVKSEESDFTKTDSELKGTIKDFALGSFKDYSLTNEIYAVGIILNYIFHGRKNFSRSSGSNLEFIVNKCTDSDLEARYASVQEILKDVDALIEEAIL